MRGRSSVLIDLGELADRLDEINIEDEGELHGALTSGLESITDKAATQALGAMASPGRILREYRAFQGGFESRLWKAWKRALDIFDLTRVLSLEFGADLNETSRPAAAAQQDFVFEALTRLHGRACLAASEIAALLRTGHATGANARWRTLHELAVVALFIKEHGPEVAQRYLEHQVIEVHKRAEEYQRHCESMGSEPLDDGEVERLRRERNRLVSRYGPHYKNQHGWAAEVLGIKGPTFAQIERSIDMDVWRPYVGMAQHGVHAGPRGAFFDLGLPDAGEMIPSGPSHFGLADPGMNSLRSLLLATLPLIVYGLNLAESDRAQMVRGTVLITQMKMLQGLVEIGAEAFLDAHQLEEESRPEAGNPPRIWGGPKLED